MAATIFALATAPGKAGVAIIRASGPQAHHLAGALGGPLPAPRMMALRRIMHEGDLIDHGLVVIFTEGASYTGEDMVEFHLHGGRAIIERMLSTLSASGARMAMPGEFTERAFRNGVLDLSQAEAVADLIDAETEAQRKQAAAVVDGALSRLVEDIQADARECLSNIEASIDFADEEDAPMDVSPLVAARLAKMEQRLSDLLEGAERARQVREGYNVVLIGPPNVGKSSLINALTMSETAIVSPFAGTTRDVLSSTCSLFGLPVTFHDTAGLRETDDEVERIGIARAVDRAHAADLRLVLRASDVDAGNEADLLQPNDITVWTKRDLGFGEADIATSVSEPESIDALRRVIFERLSSNASPSAIVAHERQRSHIAAALESITAAKQETASEVQAHLLRQGLRSLRGLVEAVDIEDVLGDIFSRFCIGK